MHSSLFVFKNFLCNQNQFPLTLKSNSQNNKMKSLFQSGPLPFSNFNEIRKESIGNFKLNVLKFQIF